eukprot:Phypoly_transcript_03403.p1 GENE.Phypoly_transcript_03403~~Phypoly_transcript_03403.p1  ORF type:complete len:406 (+),score=52.10 Phypoly_transcript_03403:1174-2391(+)
MHRGYKVGNVQKLLKKDNPQSPGFVCNNTVTTKCTFPSVCGNSTSTCPPQQVHPADACDSCGGDNTSCTNAGRCGDGACNKDLSETCSSCFLDCGQCAAIPCVENCNGRGTCDNGKCICDLSYSGPSCKTEIIPIGTNTSGTSVVIAVSDQVYFSVALNEIAEISEGAVISSYSLSIRNISGSPTNLTGGAQQLTYQINLPNSAVVLLHFFLTQDSSLSVQFGNTTINVQPNSIKLSVEVINWPFKSVKNQLRVSLNVSAEKSDPCSNLNSVSDNSGNIRWVELSVNQLTLYGSFLDYALIDEVQKPMQVNLDKSTSVFSFILPHFWVHAVIDPDFAVLLGEDRQVNSKGGCGPDIKNNSNHKAVIIAVCVAIGGAALVVAAGLLILRHKKRQTMIKLHSYSSNQ